MSKLRLFAVLAILLLPVPGLAAGGAEDDAADPLGEPPVGASGLPPAMQEVPATGVPTVDALTQHDCGSGRDGTPEEPVALVPPVSCDAYIGGMDGVDVYAFHVPAQTNVRADLAAPSELLGSLCLDPAPAGTWCGYVDGAGRASVRASYAEATDVLLRVERISGASAYGLVVRADPWALGPDCGTEADAPGLRASALPVDASGCRGTLSPDDARDWFRVELPAGATRVGVQPNPYSDYRLCVASEVPLEWVDCTMNYPPGPRDGAVLVDAPEGGVFYARVDRISGAGPYDLRFDPVAPQSDCGLAGDGGSWIRAVPAALPLACDGVLDAALGDTQDTLSITPARRSLMADAMLPDGARLCAWGDGVPGRCVFAQEGHARMILLTTAAGSVELSVTGGPAAYAYRLFALDFEPHAQDDCGTGADASAEAVAMAFPLSCEGALRGDDGDVEDGYSLPAPAGLLRARLEDAAPGLRVCMAQWTSPTSYYHRCADAADGVAAVAVWNDEAGDRRVWVEGPETPGVRPYRLVVSVEAVDDCGTGREGADDLDDARVIQPGTCAGRLDGDLDDRGDWYALEARAGETIHARLASAGSEAMVCIGRPDGSEYQCVGNALAAAGYAVVADEGGAWRVGVQAPLFSATSSEGAYTLETRVVGAPALGV